MSKEPGPGRQWRVCSLGDDVSIDELEENLVRHLAAGPPMWQVRPAHPRASYFATELTAANLIGRPRWLMTERRVLGAVPVELPVFSKCAREAGCCGSATPVQIPTSDLATVSINFFYHAGRRLAEFGSRE